MSKQKEEMLEGIHTLMLASMLEDLKDPDKRTPSLYSAIIKELQRNNIDIVPKAGDTDSALAKLLAGVQELDDSDYIPKGLN